ncbi:RNA polymerase sigma factor [Bacteroidota bacterium]
MLPEEELIKRCLDNDEKAQEMLYKCFATKMYAVCMRFARNNMNADDIFQEGFIRVFTNLKDYSFRGSLEGWIRRTMINTAINFYKKNLRYQDELNADYLTEQGVEESAIDKLSAEELLKLIQELPEGFRMVFNLYVIEGYNHKEIGIKLNISENTSKSQLARARKVLQRKVKEVYNITSYATAK